MGKSSTRTAEVYFCNTSMIRPRIESSRRAMRCIAGEASKISKPNHNQWINTDNYNQPADNSITYRKFSPNNPMHCIPVLMAHNQSKKVWETNHNLQMIRPWIESSRQAVRFISAEASATVI